MRFPFGRRAASPLIAIKGRFERATTLADVVAVLRDSARAVAGADGITVVRRIGDDVMYVDEDAITPLWKGQRFPLRTCVSGMAMVARAPIVIPDIMLDKRVPLNAYLATFVKSMAMVPIGAGEPMMAMGAYWREPQDIPAATVERMVALAALAGAAIERIEGPEQQRVA